MKNKFLRFMGLEGGSVSRAEKLVSTLGGIVGISLVAFVSFQVTGAAGAALIVPSMGASAVLVFAVPHGKLSQPWPLIGGHVISALIGVLCYQLVPLPFLAAGLAVGLAIGAMHLTKSIHPPGGATALAAVIGGPAIHQLGYAYTLTPILLNVAIIFVVALVFNGIFPWRRYPASMVRFTDTPATSTGKKQQLIENSHIELALKDMDLVMDVTTDDLHQLFSLALQHAHPQQLSAKQIVLGRYYTNGRHGADWSVRQVIDESNSPDPHKDMVIYRVVEGQGLKSSDSSTREEFALWAARELYLQ